jgi:hypothetical protein
MGKEGERRGGEMDYEGHDLTLALHGQLLGGFSFFGLKFGSIASLGLDFCFCFFDLF